jgi:hypothetical protein
MLISNNLKHVIVLINTYRTFVSQLETSTFLIKIKVARNVLGVT